MRKILLFLLTLMCIAQLAQAQPATYSNPVGLGRNNSGNASGGNAFFKTLQDSVFFFNYQSPLLTPTATAITGCQPVFKTNYAPLNTYNRLGLSKNQPFSPYDASIAFNPADQMLYYVWTDYNIAAPYKSYIWRWDPKTCPVSAVPGLDTLRTFNTDIGGIVFDANGLGWQLEFSGAAPFQARLRPVNFNTGVIGIPDTLDLTGGKKLYNVNTGDITLTPSGQMYFVFNNKLFTPDYGSYGGATKHITCTYIDTIKNPTGATGLPGLTFGNGDLIAAYSPGAPYRRIDGITGDTNYISYGGFSPASKAVASFDMTAINSGIGSSKKLASLTPTGTPGQYIVVYDVYTRNYGNVPLSNVQVTDDLKSINGVANVSSVTAVLTSNPAGVTLNPGYNGTSDINLLTGTDSLKCYPVAINNFTIRITCTISNVVQGIVYNNSAIATAKGFKNVALRDSSFNGSNPDGNQNDKTDDVGEGQPTPFLIAIDPTPTPCTPFSITTYNQDFGTGVGLNSTIPASVAVPSATSGYAGLAVQPLGINKFTVTNNPNLGDNANWLTMADHTGNANGRMLVVNADAAAKVMYQDTLPTSCPGQQYSLSFWAAFVGNPSYQTVCNGLGGFKYPKLKMELVDITTGLTVVTLTTANITSTSWNELGMTFVMPPGYFNLILKISNAGVGGCGNDIAIDDIKFGSCNALPIANASGTLLACLGTTATFTSSLSNPATLPGPKDYQWQVASALAGPYTDISGATASTYSIPTLSAGDINKYYRVIIAGQGNIGVVSCQFISPAVLLNGVTPSVSPTSVTVTAPAICGSGSTTLTAVGGTLGTGANYQWGTGSVIGTNPIAGATNSTLTITPAGTTTYWVQIQNTTAPCSASSGGVTQVVTVNQPSTAPTSVTGADFCSPGSTTLTALGGALGTGANYQWGTGTIIGTSPIAGATSSTLTVSPGTSTTYWVRIENTTAPCTVNTGGLTKLITVTQSSVAAVSATKNKNNICPGISVSLGITGGTLGSGASWKWYTGSPGGTLVGTGATLSVTPLVTTTYYVRAEGTCNTTSDQSVTVFINCNIDKDKDGIPDYVESNMAASFADANSNGVTNAYDPTYAGFVDNNNDFINDNYQADGDSDNDGIPNYLDATFPGRVDSNSDGVDDRFDIDKDGVINMLDLDSDNDGIPDVVEAYGVDTDGNGLIDNYTDTDGDGLTQSVDINNTGAYNTGIGLGVPDFDGDGVPNFLDLDSDNDGIPDIIEAGGADTNNNGMADGAIGTDGMPVAYTGVGALLITGADINGDGKADSYPNKNLDRDFRPNAYDIDADGDGIVDAIEAGGAITDTNLDGKADGLLSTNGWSTSVSGMIALNLRNTDGSGNSDYLDIDSDNDGIPDNIEGMSTVGYIRPISSTDTDGDGLINLYDNSAGFGGSGIFVYDHDSDGTPDYRDLDTDSDGQPDIIEGNDFNLNGKPDDLVTLTGLDTDGDGLDNRFDSLNSVTNLKGTSYMMGTGGSFTGDAIPGSRATVQKTFSAQTDRDWRFTSTVLPVQFLQFAGVPQDNAVLLSWAIITQKNIDRFEIERSLDNSVYHKTGVVSDQVKLNEQQSFAFTDYIAGISNDVIYYRLKVIAKTGESKYSNVLVVRRIQTRSMVNIMPNPAYNYVNVNLYVEKNSQGTVTVIDKLGRRVMTQETKFVKGTNNIYLPLEKYAQGVYSIVIETSTEKIIKQLIIAR